MTENRERYLANISAEERQLRADIAKQKVRIKRYKECLYMGNWDDFEEDERIFKRGIAYHKRILKALKKQLPMRYPCETCIGKESGCKPYRDAWMWYCPVDGQRLK